MHRLFRLTVFVLLVGLVNSFADSTPPDPIIDIESGTGTQPFNGTFVFTINGNDPNCSGQGPIVTCGNRDANGNLFFFRTPVLGNVTASNIVNFDFVFSTAQDGFQPGTPKDSDPPHNPLFTTVTTVSPFEAIYSGSTITNNCSFDGEVLFCDPGSEFTIGFAEVFVPANGVETITIRSNVSSAPEPRSLVLVLPAVLILWASRRKRFVPHTA